MKVRRAAALPSTIIASSSDLTTITVMDVDNTLPEENHVQKEKEHANPGDLDDLMGMMDNLVVGKRNKGFEDGKRIGGVRRAFGGRW
jgi:hypothetical protein